MPSFSSQLLLTSAASSSGLIPLADIDLIKGAFKVYPDLGTLQNESVTFFTDKQVVMTGDTGRLYQATVTLADFISVFEDSASFSEFTFTGLTADVPDGTISGSAQIAALGYILSSQTSSFVLNSQTSSFALKSEISGAFTAASSSISTRLTLLESGEGTVPDGTVSSSAQTIANLAGTNIVSSSTQTIANLQGSGILSGSSSVPAGTISGSQQITDLGFVNSSQTSSMSVATASYIDPTFISASAAAAGFGSSGGTTTDISALNAFTASAQVSLTALNSATSSYALKTQISGAFAQDSASISTRLTSLEAGGGNVPDGTISGSQQITDLGFVNQSQTSSMSVLSALTASFISDTFISASAVRSGFGTATLPSGLLSSSAQIAVEISGAFAEVSGGLAGRITTLEATSGGDVTALNLFTSSIQTQVDNLTAETSSYLTAADTASFIVVSQTSSMSVATASYIDPTFISASAAAAGFGSGGSTIPAGTVSSSAQVVQNLVGQDVVVSSITAETYIVSSSVSYITTSFSSGSTKFGDDLNDTHTFTGSLLLTGSITANTFIGNLNYDYLTNLPNLISSSAQIALLGAGILSSSAQIASQISGAFTSLSSSLASRITALEAAGPGGGSGIFALTGSFYSTTNNLQITGSLSVGSNSFKAFEVDADGFVVLGESDKDLNTAPVGTIVYSGSGFYLIS